MTNAIPGVAPDYQIPDELWQRIAPLLPKPKPKKKPGRPRMDDRQALTAIFYLLRTGCQWEALPRCLGARSTVHDRFQEWRAAGFFQHLWQEGLAAYDAVEGLDWEWQSMDAAMTKAPLGGKDTGHNPTDRSKIGTKRSILTEGNGMPVAVMVAGANRHDMKLTEGTLERLVVTRPDPTAAAPQHLCLDKGYDYPQIEELVARWGYTAHIRRIGEDASTQERTPGYRARRWVVERTHSWMNRFRRMLIRWEKKNENYLALVHFACAWITFRAARLFG
ncbi:MAG TPA: IS5 family transposase [Armatimonadota bacterium]|nr:IS5 family transposase [Armatimonadota bacterium]